MKKEARAIQWRSPKVLCYKEVDARHLPVRFWYSLLKRQFVEIYLSSTYKFTKLPGYHLPAGYLGSSCQHHKSLHFHFQSCDINRRSSMLASSDQEYYSAVTKKDRSSANPLVQVAWGSQVPKKVALVLEAETWDNNACKAALLSVATLPGCLTGHTSVFPGKWI